MRRRAFLAGGAGTAVALTALTACSDSAEGQDQAAGDRQAEAAELREKYNEKFDPDYVDNVIVPFFLNSIYDGQRPVLPMIDVALTKENALPYDLWGLLSESWKPAPDEGVTVFLQGLEKRGPDNRRKRIYMSAVTPDLYRPMYQRQDRTLLRRAARPPRTPANR